METLDLPITQPAPIMMDNVYDIVRCDTSTVIALLIPEVLLQHAKDSWSKPTLVLLLSQSQDHMYWVRQKEMEFLFMHFTPNFLLVTSSSKGKKHHSIPNEEVRRTDAAGRKFYTLEALKIKDQAM